MYKFNIEKNEIEALDEVSFAELNYKEKVIEEWVEKNPSIIDDNLLIISKQYSFKKYNLITDLLAIDEKGNLVIIEIKRDTSTKHLDWQAIKYASLCSFLTPDDIIKMLSEHQKIPYEKAKDDIKAHISNGDYDELDFNLNERLNKKQRVILLSKSYEDEILLTCKWLTEQKIDLQCYTCIPYINKKNEIYISINKILPVTPPVTYNNGEEIITKTNYGLSGKNYASDIVSYSADELKTKLYNTINNSNKQRSRLIYFFETLSISPQGISREEIIKGLTDLKLSENLSQAGTHLSNISQLITNKNNSHLRQILTFQGELRPGARKDLYKINPDYFNIVLDVLNSLKDYKKAA
jgi:hypothetical protein